MQVTSVTAQANLLSLILDLGLICVYLAWCVPLARNFSAEAEGTGTFYVQHYIRYFHGREGSNCGFLGYNTA
jgi:hypothetical protein